MGAAIGAILPHAVGIALSPLPIIAVILLLLSGRARSTSIGFLLGWIAGVAVGTAVFTVIATAFVTTAPPAWVRPTVGVVQIALGVLLLALAARQWRRRRGPGVEPALPAWLAAIDRLRFGTALGLGVLLSAVSPKNLVLLASAGVLLGGTNLTIAQAVATVAVFTLVASLTIAVPVVIALVAGDRVRTALGALHDWLVRENAVIMAVVFVVLAAVVIGKGLPALF